MLLNACVSQSPRLRGLGMHPIHCILHCSHDLERIPRLRTRQWRVSASPQVAAKRPQYKSCHSYSICDSSHFSYSGSSTRARFGGGPESWAAFPGTPISILASFHRRPPPKHFKTFTRHNQHHNTPHTATPPLEVKNNIRTQTRLIWYWWRRRDDAAKVCCRLFPL